MNKQQKSFLLAISTLFLIMIVAYALTFLIDDAYISFNKWLFSPILVLGSSNGTTTIAVIIFLLIIGGISNLLEQCGITEYMINKIAHRYGKRKYQLILVLTFLFMALGSLIGSFEEIVALVPIVISLSKKLGFDNKLGLGMSVLAIGCGFSAGVFNPFTIGVAQELAGLAMFSGFEYRLVSFILIYFVLNIFLYLYAKKISKNNEIIEFDFVSDINKDKALRSFVIVMGLGLLLVFISPFIKVLQDYTMIIIALAFLIGGLLSASNCKLGSKLTFKYFINGVVEISPSILLILMACSIKFTFEESGVLTSILSNITNLASSMSKKDLIIFIYLICLVMNLFIPSGSAKAFLLMPLIIPLAQMFDLNMQLCILAFAFGDGFTNVLYPTNPVLLISLGVSNVSYSDWFKFSIPFQLVNFGLTSGLLILGLYIL